MSVPRASAREAVRAGGNEGLSEIGVPLGLALAAGVPAIVLVAVGLVAAHAGAASILVWILSALVGFLMAFSFAELVSRFPDARGGIAGAGAAALRSRNRSLAGLVQWSYWLGWSPALAISAALIAEYVHEHYLPTSLTWVSWMIATAILGLAAFVNHLGIRPSAWLQLALVVSLIAPAAALVAAPLVGNRFDAHRISLDLPGGWTSWEGLSAFGGALFLAAGAPTAPRRRSRTRPSTGAVPVTPFSSSSARPPPSSSSVRRPIAAARRSGGDRARRRSHGLDPLSRRCKLVGRTCRGAAASRQLRPHAQPLSASDARVLYQMGRSGDAWAFLGRLNARGAPGNALLFDAGANAAYLALGLAATSGNFPPFPPHCSRRLASVTT